MNDLLFVLPPAENGPAARWSLLATSIYLATWDGIAVSSFCTCDKGALRLGMRVGESGYLIVPWITRSGRHLTLTTATVRARQEPYRLAVEVARGTLGRVRAWWDEWQRLGWSVPDSIKNDLNAAQAACATAVCHPYEAGIAEPAAEECIDLSLRVIEQLSHCYVAALCSSLSEVGKSNHVAAVLVARMPDPLPRGEEADNLISNFRGALVSTDSIVQVERDMAWCESRFDLIILGPCVDFRTPRQPFESTLAESPEQVAQLASSMRLIAEVSHDRVGLWYASAGLEGSQDPASPYLDQRLEILAGIIAGIRAVDPNALVMVGIAQPWGEYLATRSDELTPPEIARNAFRAGLGISAFGLEIAIGPENASGYPRDELAILNLLDSWAQFEVPLVIILSALREVDPMEDSEPSSSTSDDSIADTLSRLVPLLSRHQAVMAIVWEPWRRDGANSREIHALWDAESGATSLLQAWLAAILRQRFDPLD